MLKTIIAFLITIACVIAIVKAHNRYIIENSPHYRDLIRFDQIENILLNSNQQK